MMNVWAENEELVLSFGAELETYNSGSLRIFGYEGKFWSKYQVAPGGRWWTTRAFHSFLSAKIAAQTAIDAYYKKINATNAVITNTPIVDSRSFTEMVNSFQSKWAAYLPDQSSTQVPPPYATWDAYLAGKTTPQERMQIVQEGTIILREARKSFLRSTLDELDYSVNLGFGFVEGTVASYDDVLSPWAILQQVIAVGKGVDTVIQKGLTSATYLGLATYNRALPGNITLTRLENKLDAKLADSDKKDAQAMDSFIKMFSTDGIVVITSALAQSVDIPPYLGIQAGDPGVLAYREGFGAGYLTGLLSQAVATTVAAKNPGAVVTLFMSDARLARILRTAKYAKEMELAYGGMVFDDLIEIAQLVKEGKYVSAERVINALRPIGGGSEWSQLALLTDRLVAWTFASKSITNFEIVSLAKVFEGGKYAGITESAVQTLRASSKSKRAFITWMKLVFSGKITPSAADRVALQAVAEGKAEFIQLHHILTDKWKTEPEYTKLFQSILAEKFPGLPLTLQDDWNLAWVANHAGPHNEAAVLKAFDAIAKETAGNGDLYLKRMEEFKLYVVTHPEEFEILK